MTKVSELFSTLNFVYKDDEFESLFEKYSAKHDPEKVVNVLELNQDNIDKIIEQNKYGRRIIIKYCEQYITTEEAFILIDMVKGSFILFTLGDHLVEFLDDPKYKNRYQFYPKKHIARYYKKLEDWKKL